VSPGAAMHTLERATNAFMKMKTFDIATLKKAE
jgi:hypothetical protein